MTSLYIVATQERFHPQFRGLEGMVLWPAGVSILPRQRELDYQTIVERPRGPVGSSVQLDVFRKGEVNTVVVMRQPYSK